METFFKTTNLAIPETEPLAPHTFFSVKQYRLTLAAEIFMFLIIFSYFVMSVIRVVKKIKNPSFNNDKFDSDDKNQTNES